MSLRAEEEHEAVVLLAELVLDGYNRRAGVSGSVLDGASDGAFASVVPFLERRRKARDGA